MQWSDRIGRRIKLRDLHIFLAVARCGSMARAAGLLSVSQPVVSKTISELEHALGVRLLDRTFQGVEPTAYGRAIVNCGIAVFDDLRRGVQEIEYLSDPTTGELRVGATLPLMEDLVPGVVKLRAVAPELLRAVRQRILIVNQRIVRFDQRRQLRSLCGGVPACVRDGIP